MTVRFTVLCPKLAQHKAKGQPPDDVKKYYEIMRKITPEEGMEDLFVPIELTPHEVEFIKGWEQQGEVNKKYNQRGEILGNRLIHKLKDVDITWCNDGCLVISCDNSLPEVEQVIDEEGLEIQKDRSNIKHRVKQIDSNDQSKGSEEDIDDIFEPKSNSTKKKLKSRSVINKFKVKKGLT